MVAVAGNMRSPVVLHRSRVEMVTGTGFRARQPYHAAAEMSLGEAEKFVTAALQSATDQAAASLRPLISRFEEQESGLKGGGILLASGRKLPDVGSILRSHALIHAAEGELFRRALMQACEQWKIKLAGFPEREIMSTASERLKLEESAIRSQLSEMGQAVGRPWTQDEKLATLAAWLQLPI